MGGCVSPGPAMPPDAETVAERDERLGRLARQWFAEVRAQEADEAAAERRAHRASRNRSADGDGPWDWLFGDGDGDGDGGSD